MDEKEVRAIETLRALDGKKISIYKIHNYKIAAFSEKQAKLLLSKGIIRKEETDVGIITIGRVGKVGNHSGVVPGSVFCPFYTQKY